MHKKMVICLVAGSFVLLAAGLVFAMNCAGEHGHESTGSAASVAPQEAVNVGNKVCPVSGEKIDENTKATYEYQGKIYNFCCPACIGVFKQDPEKYIEKVEAELKTKAK